MNPLLLRLLLGISMLALSCAASHAMEPEDVPYAFLEQAAPLGIAHATNYLQLLPAELREYLIKLMTVSKSPYELGQNLRGIVLSPEFSQYLPILIEHQKNPFRKAMFILGLDIPEVTEILIQEIISSATTKKTFRQWVEMTLFHWSQPNEHVPMELGALTLFNLLITPRQFNGKLQPVIDLTDIFNSDFGQIRIAQAIRYGNTAFIEFILNNAQINLEKAMSSALEPESINNQSVDIIKLLLQHLSTDPYKMRIVFTHKTRWGPLLSDILRSGHPISFDILHLLLEESLINPIVSIDLEYLFNLARIKYFLLNQGQFDTDTAALINAKLDLVTEYLDITKNIYGIK